MLMLRIVPIVPIVANIVTKDKPSEGFSNRYLQRLDCLIDSNPRDKGYAKVFSEPA
jgi:hypothetical protein